MKKAAPTKAPRKKPAPKKARLSISDEQVMLAKIGGRNSKQRVKPSGLGIFAHAVPPPSVVPSGAGIAQDSAVTLTSTWAAQALYNGAFFEGVTFLGYPYLSELAQRPEYRRITETIATEMTRKWIKLQAVDTEEDSEKEEANKTDEINPTDPSQQQPKPKPAFGKDAFDPKALQAQSQPSDPQQLQNAKPGQPPKPGDKPDQFNPKDLANQIKKADKAKKIKELEDELVRLGVRDAFRRVAEMDGFFGRGHLALDFGMNDDPAELKTPIGDGANEISLAKIPKGSFKRVKAVEPVWTYPANYNSNNPLKSNWYKPDSWFVQGIELHASRLLTFIGREVPDLLKPAYSFGGLSLSQMAKPYVDNWLKTRQSVSDIISAFSVFVLKTNMGEMLQDKGGKLMQRADFFNNVRDNRGLMMVDKELEDFANISAPLSSLDLLQAQSQEHMASVSGIPLVKLLGIQPAGLNASSEGEIRVFYDWIAAYQELLFTKNLKRVINFAQLSLWGHVDPDITFVYEPLWSLDDLQLATKRKTDADTAAVYLGDGVLHPEEVRKAVASDPESPYASIDVGDIPDKPEPEFNPFMDGPNGPNAEGGDKQDGPPKPEGPAKQEQAPPKAAA